MLMGRGSPGESLLAYSATCSAVCRSIVWGQGRAIDSNAFQYQPLRHLKASCTSPLASLALIAAPTWAVRAARSIFNKAHIHLCIVRAAIWQSLPVWQSMVRWLMMVHVSSEIQSFPSQHFGLGFLHLSLSISKLRVNSSYSPGGSRRGKGCRCQRYFNSRLICLEWKEVTTAQ
jgi:hypothetical protein